MTFIEGFTCWNDGHRRMERHEKSASHKQAMQAIHNQHSVRKVNELLDANVKTSKKDNHDMLSYVIEAIRTLGRQGLALRGSFQHHDGPTSEPDSNLWQILQAFSRNSERLRTLLSKSMTYCSPKVQNELLGLMGNTVQRIVADKIRRAPFYSLMIDETSDITGKEQTVICFRLFSYFALYLFTALYR